MSISYTVIKSAEAPVIDGVLNEECWGKAHTGEFLFNLDGSKADISTKIRAVYDDTNLYLGFECRDSDAASTVTGRDSPISSEEYVAAYLDADSDSSTYVVIEVSPTGAFSDAFVLCRNNGADKKTLSCWNSDLLRVSVSVYGGGARPDTDDRFWTVELAIPFKDFYTAPHVPPLKGETWRADFFRVELTKNRSYYSLSPTKTNSFDKPGQFARLIFGE
ncbi:MAG: carbohydrate-binding family 9-like protein [Candidatus Latescibacteria bacterium]|nr:carbohydrate-binding family 9-like protein [Candidatus Latescibacterota bacterium]